MTAASRSGRHGMAFIRQNERVNVLDGQLMEKNVHSDDVIREY